MCILNFPGLNSNYSFTFLEYRFFYNNFGMIFINLIKKNRTILIIKLNAKQNSIWFSIVCDNFLDLSPNLKFCSWLTSLKFCSLSICKLEIPFSFLKYEYWNKLIFKRKFFFCRKFYILYLSDRFWRFCKSIS